MGKILGNKILGNNILENTINNTKINNINDDLEDPNINQKIASNPNNSVFVSASAGTGKTKVLTDRVLRLLLTDTKIENIICITFTKIAAKEMSFRIYKILGEWAFLSEEKLSVEIQKLTGVNPSLEEVFKAKNLFNEIINSNNGLKVQTIHSFCQHILQKFPKEADVLPNFNVIDDKKAEQIKTDVIKEVLTSNWKNSKNSLALKENFETILKHISNADTFKERISSVLMQSSLMDMVNDAYKNKEELKSSIYEFFDCSLQDNSEKIKINFIQNIHYENLKKVANILLEVDSKLAEKILSFITKKSDEKILNKNFKEYKSIFFTTTNTERKNIITKTTLKKVNDSDSNFVTEVIEEEKQKLINFITQYQNSSTAEINFAFMELAKGIYTKYQKRKEEMGFLDFNDLINKTLKLFKKAEMIAWVFYKLDSKIHHILVDEAQDTSSYQWKIIELLTEEFFSGKGSLEDINRTLFIVGDIKQSIFRFQGANPEILYQVKNLFAKKIADAKKKFVEVPLNVSFRSNMPIIKFVNKVIPFLFDENLDIYKNQNFKHFNFKNEMGKVELLPIVFDMENQPDSRYSVMAKFIVAKIKSLIENKDLGISYGDIMILYKKRENNKIIPLLIQMLNKENIPVLGVDRIKINQNVAILDFLSLIKFLLQNKDNMSLANVLKSPFFNLDDNEIFELKYNKEDLFLHLATVENIKYKEIYETLKSWNNLAKNNHPFEFFYKILLIEKNINKFTSRLGIETLEPIFEFLNIALNYNNDTNFSLQDFLNYIIASNTVIKKDMDTKKNEVLFLTIHASKGMEAKAVFLLDDLNAKNIKDNFIKAFTPNPFLLIKPKKELMAKKLQDMEEVEQDEIHSENKRLLYVAITRARNFLFFCPVAKSPAKEKKDDEEAFPNTFFSVLEKSIDGDFIKNNENESFIEKEFCYGNKFGEKTPSLVLHNTGAETISNTSLYVENFYGESNNDIDKNDFLEIIKLIKEEDLITKKNIDTIERENENNIIKNTFYGIKKLDENLLVGIITHKIMEIIPENINNYKEMDNKINFYLEKYKNSISTKVSEEIKLNISKLLKNETIVELFNKKTFKEISLSGYVDNKEVIYRIDLLIVDDLNKEIIIIDYKNAEINKIKQSLMEEYKNQIINYKNAVAKIYTDFKIKTFLLFIKSLTLQEICD